MGAVDESSELSNEVVGVIPLLAVTFRNSRIVNALRNEEETDLEGLVQTILLNANTGRPNQG